MKKANSINTMISSKITMISSKIKELTILRRSCVDWKQKEIDKEIVELKKLKKDVKKSRN